MGQMVQLLLPALQMQFGPKSPPSVFWVSELNISISECCFSLLHMKQGKIDMVKRKKCN